jgi:hypothetical protein
MKNQQLEKHLRRLARKHKVKVRRWCAYKHGEPGHRGLGGLSNLDLRTIWIPEIRSRASYTVAMHELGHILGPWQGASVLLREAGAWKWARENCLQWGKIEEKTMHRGMVSYYNMAVFENLKGKKRPLAIPPKGHYFWSCLPATTPSTGPEWLAPRLAVVPWQRVMAHEERPRCATCTHWRPHHKDAQKGREWGTCTSPAQPMGATPLTPEDAVCGTDYDANLGFVVGAPC